MHSLRHMESHVAVKRRSEVLRCVSEVLSTLAITSQARYGHDQMRFNTRKECFVWPWSDRVLTMSVPWMRYELKLSVPWAYRDLNVRVTWASREPTVNAPWASCERTVSPPWSYRERTVSPPWAKRDRFQSTYFFRAIEVAYKLSEEFAKPYFHKYWTETHDVTTIRKRNVCSFIVTLNAFDVRPSCDTADVQAILPFPPNPLKHVLCDVPDCGVDALWQFW